MAEADPQAQLAQLRALNANLAAYREISERLFAATSTEAVAGIVSAALEEVCGAEGAVLLLSGDCPAPLAYAPPGGAWHRVPEQVRSWLTQATVEQRRELVEDDTAAFLERQGLPPAPALRNLLALPLLIVNECMGGIVACNFMLPEHLARYLLDARALLTPVSYALAHVQLIEAHDRQAVRAEAGLAQLRAVLDSMSEGVVICELDGRLLAINPAALRLHGVGTPADPGRQLLPEVEVADLQGHPLPPQDRPLARALRGEQFSHLQVQIRATGEQDWRICSYHGTPVLDHSGRPALAVVTIHDITAEKEAERAKDLFLAVVSHELLTPLTSILGWAQLARATQDPTVAGQALQVIEVNALRQKRLVDDLLDVSRLVHNKMRISPEPCELGLLATQSVDSVQQVANEREITLQLVQSREPLPLHADPGRILQALGNLLTNALKFAPSGTKVTVTVERAGAYGVVSVSDEGSGIPPDQLETVFEPFRQLHRQQVSHGLGLGLALVRGIAELHGGEVSAASLGPDRGSTFRLRLPLATGSAAA